ncbi:ferritin [Alkalitalea saponilacus]|uniref:Ferritin n=1 Tax=Alkalitalea saponilacus TaxID=889453 RepID=A0A1T5D373_9BACT|nr:ferritin [Alkalitalea saponilacus]ASB50557.1 ferritin [Alkalitalea saponilacus]SKB66086.1 ferritin [Alkalitalea saponilacus]
MLNKKVEKALVAQIEKEGYSSNLYLAMASWAETKGMEGVSKWMYAQADEERMHMLKFIAYVNERGGKAIIPAFEKPPVDFDNVHKMFEQVLSHEQYVTKSINDIVGVCLGEKDFTTHNWIQWFVEEQIEEEASAQTIIDKLNLLGDGGLYLFDRDILSMRTESEPGAE